MENTEKAFTEPFIITQGQVNAFAHLSGDTNPLHIDADYAASTTFKKPIVHGIFTASVFSKVLGTKFPGPGSIYVGQQLDFKRPVYPDTEYIAHFEIVEINSKRHSASIKTTVTDAQTGKVAIEGMATVINKEKF